MSDPPIFLQYFMYFPLYVNIKNTPISNPDKGQAEMVKQCLL